MLQLQVFGGVATIARTQAGAISSARFRTEPTASLRGGLSLRFDDRLQADQEEARYTGRPIGESTARGRVIDVFLPKVVECVESLKGGISADKPESAPAGV